VRGQTTKHKQGYNGAENHIGSIKGVNFLIGKIKTVLDSAFNFYNNQVFMATKTDGNPRHT
jgi:hypothetical protein